MDKTTLFWVLSVFGLFLLVAITVVSSIISGLSKNKEIWANKWAKEKKVAGLMILFGLLSMNAYAQDSVPADAGWVVSDMGLWTVISLDALLIGLLFVLLKVLRELVAALQEKKAGEEVVATKNETANVWMQRLTDAVPVERESEVLTDHEYDGIRELDNNLPPWWKWGFVASIIAGVFYLMHFHVLGTGRLQLEEYTYNVNEAEAEVAAFLAEKAENVDESSVILLTASDRIKSGRSIYVENCATCHGQQGEGLVGPNFADQYWLHGGDIQSIFKTIKYGVPEKGMISWEPILTPVKIQEVASYIVTLQGTNPLNPKAPQGKLYIPEGEDTTPEANPTDSIQQANDAPEVEGEAATDVAVR